MGRLFDERALSDAIEAIGFALNEGIAVTGASSNAARMFAPVAPLMSTCLAVLEDEPAAGVG